MNPLCPSGTATLTTPCVTPKYWQWPEWNSDSLYLNSRTALGEASSVQLRAFYVRYANSVAMFDDATYSTMNQNGSSGMLINHDHSIGVSGEFETRRVARHTIGASFFVNNDTHMEQTTTFSKTNVASTTPSQSDQDRQSSFGIQDVVTVSSTETGGTLFVTIAKKSRFPTLKDRYSYKAGNAIPNPALQLEHAKTWTAGTSRGR